MHRAWIRPDISHKMMVQTSCETAQACGKIASPFETSYAMAMIQGVAKPTTEPHHPTVLK